MLENMGARAGISVDEYLHTSFPDLDREYRDGELVERSVPDYLHGRTQALLLFFFETLRKKLSFYACSETRVKVREGLYLIPDVSVFRPSPPPSSLPDQPPFIAVEILSPDDRLNAVREKLEEYKSWGVPHVWLVDPHSRRMYTCQTAGLTEVSSLRIPELDVEVMPDEIFE
jgi:Uma2 family endonuclease